MSIAVVLAAAASTQSLTICADRPTKANSVCTVPARHLQVEISPVDWTRNRDQASLTETTSVGATFVKFGLSDTSDIEAAFSPYVQVHSRVPGGGPTYSGAGDFLVRYKRRLTTSDAPVQAGIIPFIKIPTASRHIGNGEIEGGVAVPVSIRTAGPLAVTLGPELDWLADADRSGHHLAVTNLINLSVAAAPRLTLAAELWSSVNLEPAGTLRLWSSDVAAAYAIGDRLQLDAGANFGLNRPTPDLEFYAGVSVLF